MDNKFSFWFRSELLQEKMSYQISMSHVFKTWKCRTCKLFFKAKLNEIHSLLKIKFWKELKDIRNLCFSYSKKGFSLQIKYNLWKCGNTFSEDIRDTITDSYFEKSDIINISPSSSGNNPKSKIKNFFSGKIKI